MDRRKAGNKHVGVIGVAILDVFGNLVLNVGLFYVGSGLYQVIYSSIIVFTALMAKCFLRRSMTWGGWIAVYIICFGLSINGFGRTDAFSEGDSSTIAVGFFMTLLGTAIYSVVYTVNDHLLSDSSNPWPPRQMCLWIGVYCTLVTFIIMLGVSVDAILAMPLSDPSVVAAYLILVLSSLGHNATYFELLEKSGAVATGVLQALRAVMVFGLSHVIFCGRDKAQCFTVQKGLATVVVVGGVLGFSYAKAVAGDGGGEIKHRRAGGFERLDDEEHEGGGRDLEHM
ncbi:hypothetical protein HK104_008035 [Borealophlyctis nickersoniae]|nr:hypothetical protein HK104_008035 [Borealophlyctis nickersoniae]